MEFVASKSSKSNFVQVDFSTDWEQGDYMVMVEQERDYDEHDQLYHLHQIFNLGASLYCDSVDDDHSVLEKVESLDFYSQIFFDKLVHNNQATHNSFAEYLAQSKFVNEQNNTIFDIDVENCIGSLISLEDDVAEKYYNFLLH